MVYTVHLDCIKNWNNQSVPRALFTDFFLILSCRCRLLGCLRGANHFSYVVICSINFKFPVCMTDRVG